MPEYRVGTLYHPGKTSWEEGTNYNFRQNTHELLLMFHQPKPVEIQAVKTGEATFGLVIQEEVILLVFKFGSMPYSDAPYTWYRVPQDQQTLPKSSTELGPNERATLTVFLVNADTGILLAIRQVSLSHDFTCMLHDAIIAQAQRPFDQVHFDRQLRLLYAEQDAKGLMKQARVTCKGGA